MATNCRPMERLRADRRGVSKVVGVVLLVAIAVALAAVAATMAFGLTQEREPAPGVVLALEYEGAGADHEFVHDGGEVLEGEKVTLQGAADPDALAGTELETGQSAPVVPTDEEIDVIWTGEHDATYRLATLEAETTAPDSDEGCPWVDTETDGGVDPIKIDGVVVNCDVRTDKGVEAFNGGVIIGETESRDNGLDLDDADTALYGDATASDTLDLQDGAIFGSATSDTANVEVDAGRITGSVTAGTEIELIGASRIDGSLSADDEIEVIDGSRVDGDVASANHAVKVNDGRVGGSVTADRDVEAVAGSSVDGDVEANDEIDVEDSTVGGDVVGDDDQVRVLDGEVAGSIVTEGDVKLDGATIEGDVYVGGAFDCTDATIDGQDCGSFAPRDPGDW